MKVVETFNNYRPYLFAIAYRMLGSVMDAEDMVQEAFVRWQQATPAEVRSPKSYLATIVTRLCLDQMQSARERRETYIGPWLPEPLPTDSAVPNEARFTGEGAAIMSESISVAFLLLLENLSPAERAVYLLREVFDYGYADIAQMVDKSEAACRQLVRRARQHLQANRRRFSAAPEESQRLTAEFFQACTDGNLDKLFSLLAEDVVEWSDGGGQVPAARKPILGRDKVARFLLGLARQAPPSMTLEFGFFNHHPGLVIRVDGRPFTIVLLEIADSKVQNIYSIVNPDKLRHISLGTGP